MDYDQLFYRNRGIFSQAEQERIRGGSILIVGCGGIGGAVATMLARSGVGRFVLVEFDTYEPTNMNRQIACFTHTIGRKKAQVVQEHILRINPESEVTVFDRYLSHAEIADLIPQVDLVFPAADDFAFSLFVFRDAQRLGKTALMVVPAGGWANVSLFPPDRPSPEDMEGVPKLDTYEALCEALATKKYKLGTYLYVPFGDWRIDYYRRFIEEGLAPTQICPLVWLSSSLGAMEVIKFLSGKWKPVTSPHYWNITRKKIRIHRINGISWQTPLVWQRKFVYWAFQTRMGPFLELLQGIWWKQFQAWSKRREERRIQGNS